MSTNVLHNSKLHRDNEIEELRALVAAERRANRSRNPSPEPPANDKQVSPDLRPATPQWGETAPKMPAVSSSLNGQQPKVSTQHSKALSQQDHWEPVLNHWGKLDSEVQMYKKKAQRAEEEIERLKLKFVELERLRGRDFELATEHAKLCSEVSVLRQQLAEAHFRLSERSREENTSNVARQSRISELEDELAAAHTEGKELARQLEVLQRRLKAGETSRPVEASVVIEMERWRDQASEFKSKSDAEQSRAVALQSQLADLRSKFESARMQHQSETERRQKIEALVLFFPFDSAALFFL